ncbi:thymidylate synthase [Sphingomonas prati]|uniref:Thymidylate synthase n=1 Tax=Sphingomonas prati TaxID=1843237 RepID=A0A7W9BUL1_9SPHN|nr:thymidylate synthase [Sphingomonas prati]MBB5730407.1 thymidylate synthase [Sphingomonas prati]GGE93837.1 thymidylate synthase [Sphingomonas prati]
MPHPEQQYLDLLHRTWTTGDERRDRTGVGTRSLFGAQLRFDLAGDAVPLLTTKRVAWKVAARELLWFLSGSTNIRPLVEQNVHIWTDWPLARYNRDTGANVDRATFEAMILADDAFAADYGDLGPVYGKQWVDWPVYEPQPDGRFVRAQTGINQIALLVESLRHNPGSRRHIFTGWNVAELDGMALPPCHMTYQYHVAAGRLSGMLWQRSCDLGLGYAFNAFSAALLLRMLAQQCDLEPGDLVWSAGDAHVYLNHEHLVTEQLSRVPTGTPKLRLLRKPATIFDYRIDDFEVYDYAPMPGISAPVAV